jgi:hypothetical protein
MTPPPSIVENAVVPTGESHATTLPSNPRANAVPNPVPPEPTVARETTCHDRADPLAVIAYRFGPSLTDAPCAVARMRAGERCHP